MEEFDMTNRATSAILALLLALVSVQITAGQTAPTSFLSTRATECPDSQVACLLPVGAEQCLDSLATCQDFDAIVFVHGIYGGDDTFKNKDTRFDWPVQFPRCVRIANNCRKVDVFRLDYRTALLSWASGTNPSFKDVAIAALQAMKPLRKRKYRSIGFIAHSLGGNVISTYIHMVKTEIGHPQRSQNAFVINLATPVLGSQIADLGTSLKKELGMKDPLLNSLEQNNLYLTMLNEFRQEEVAKEGRYSCRPVHLHAAYEKKYIGPLLIVDQQSAAISISRIVNSPILGFSLNHIEIAKPPNDQAEIYRWVMERIEDEYVRLATWDGAHERDRAEYRLCEKIPLIAEQ
jgi:hypothetical protein